MHDASRVTLTRIAKCGIGLAVMGLSALRDSLAGWVGVSRKATCVVLYYHSIPFGQRARFARQLDVLLNTAKPVDLREDMRATEGGHHVAVTFDDGFEDFIDHALPELEPRNIPATVFVIADALGKTFGSSDSSNKVMSSEQLRSLPEQLVTIGAHTSTHPMLTHLGESDARREITISRTRLEEVLRRPVMLFSFPFGDYNQELVQFCREAGYRRVFTTVPTFAFERGNEFAIGRVRVDPTDWPIEFRLKLAGTYRWLPLAFAAKRRLVTLARAIVGRKQYTQQSAAQSVIQHQDGENALAAAASPGQREAS